MTLRLSTELAGRLAARLPDGKTIEDLRLVACSATIEPLTQPSALELAALKRAEAGVETAGGPPLLSNGLPTVMRIVAWMAHEGRNKNGLTFLGQDLGPAADRIREPNFLPMDWNHSAVDPWAWDPKAIGLWYRAEKRWDPKANEGAGAYGILMQGIMWAWLFPDYATMMLAEQERHGAIDFSMACLPTRSEIQLENGRVVGEIAHEPVFMTLSALDVPPADADAVGLGVEGSDDPALETTLITQLTGTAPPADPAPAPSADLPLPGLAAAAQAPAAPQAARAPSSTAHLEEAQMEELLEQIAALQAQLAAQSTAAADLATAQGRITELEAQLVEAQTAREALVTQSTEAATAAAEAETALRAELETAQTQLAEIDAAEQARAAAERFTARLAELPESYRTALARRAEDERTAFAARWTAATDEQWETFKADALIGLTDVRVSYLQLSREEGPIGTAAASEAGSMAALLAETRVDA